MMTRGQVARRLGKSLATVRRLEGVKLHPWQDERGVYRFSRAEVERLAHGEVARTLATGRESLNFPRQLDAGASDDSENIEPFAATDGITHHPHISVLESRIRMLESDLAAQKSEFADSRTTLELRCKELQDANSRMMAFIRRELLNTLADLPRRQLLRLLNEEPELFEGLLP